MGWHFSSVVAQGGPQDVGSRSGRHGSHAGSLDNFKRQLADEPHCPEAFKDTIIAAVDKLAELGVIAGADRAAVSGGTEDTYIPHTEITCAGHIRDGMSGDVQITVVISPIPENLHL